MWCSISDLHKLDEGRSLARGEDNNHVKELIECYYKFNGKLPPKDKCGFHHLQCAYLIAPWTVDIFDPMYVFVNGYLLSLSN